MKNIAAKVELVVNKAQILAGKRVLFVLPQLELGGAERQALYLARHLKSLGCEVRVWGHHNPGLVIDECERAGIPWALYPFRWPCRKSSLFRVGWGFLRFLRALRKEPADVILAYCGWANVSAGLAWRWSPAKACIWGQRDVDGQSGDAVERFAYRRVSAVICNAEHEIGYLRRILGETPAPISVVYNGLDLEPPRKSRAEWRAELGIDQETVAAVMAANFRPEKDHLTLLSAWHKLLTDLPAGRPQPRLLLAGAPQHSYEAVYRLAESLKLLDTVKFLGQVKDVSGLLAASDIGVLTSFHEGLSNSILEYMAGGLPVVVTDLPGNREVLGDNPLQAYCKPGDVSCLAARLQELLGDPDRRQKLGRLNRHRALTKFSITTMCEKMVGIIAGLLEDHTSRGSERLKEHS